MKSYSRKLVLLASSLAIFASTISPSKTFAENPFEMAPFRFDPQYGVSQIAVGGQPVSPHAFDDVEREFQEYVKFKMAYPTALNGSANDSDNDAIRAQFPQVFEALRLKKEFDSNLIQDGIDIQKTLDEMTRESLVELEKSQPRQVKIDFGSDRANKLYRSTRFLFVIQFINLAVLYSLPESFTNWGAFNAKVAKDHGLKPKALAHYWWENVSRPPVWDKDAWSVNYIGHPYSGANYYIIARENGFDKMESFWFAVGMSTFFWEYGLEAITERPSIQDLVATPVLGSILGEAFYKIRQRIMKNDKKVLNSRILGGISLFLTNPVGEIVKCTMAGSDKLQKKVEIKTLYWIGQTDAFKTPPGMTPPAWVPKENQAKIMVRFRW